MWMDEHAALREELETVRRLEYRARDCLYGIETSGDRGWAVSALAAAAASRANLRSDGLPEWTNDTSRLWRQNLEDVWAYLGGNEERFYPLSRAIAEYLVSPLNHVEGQDGPDDFDRPQTVASYCAVASVVMWGVDFATTALAQNFDLIDLEFNGEMSLERAREIEREVAWVDRALTRIVGAAQGGGPRLDRSALADLRP